MMNKRIYLIESKSGLMPRLVKAQSQSSALRFIATQEFTVEAVGTERYGELCMAGIITEEAN